MPLVDDVQIPQNTGMRAQPSMPVAQQDLFKMAGANAALTELGLSQEKVALLGGLGTRLLTRLGGPAAIKATTEAAGKAAPGLWARTGGRVVGGIASSFGRAGNRAVDAAGRWAGASPATIAKIQGLGKGMAREATDFGLLSGGLEAALADPDERGSAFLRGAAGGALGGLAWRGAGNLASAGIKRGLGKRFGAVEAASKQPWLGKLEAGQSRLKGLGAQALIGGVPFAAGLGTSFMTPTFHGGPAKVQGQRFAAYPQRPMGYRYNPNLPIPQYGY